MTKTVGLFGGTFDPIHFGHLNLAQELYEKKGLDEVWFIPTRINPLKSYVKTASPQHCFEMVKIAIEPYPSFKVFDIEVKREGLSYTIDTIEALMEKFPDCKFHILMGEDAIPHFIYWKEPEKILQLASPYIGSRNLQIKNIPEKNPLIQQLLRGLVKTREMDISATEIRQRLKENKICKHLVPEKVLDYIMNHHLYLFL